MNKGKEEIYIKLKDKEGILNLKNKDEKAVGEFLISAFGGRENTEISVKELEKFIKKSSPTNILNIQQRIGSGFNRKLIELKIIDKEAKSNYENESGKQAVKISLILMVICLGILIIEKLGDLAIIGTIAFEVIFFLNIIISWYSNL